MSSKTIQVKVRAPYKRKDRPGWWVDIRMDGVRRKLSFPSRALANRKVREVQESKLKARISGGLAKSIKKDALISTFSAMFLKYLSHRVSAGSASGYRNYIARFNKFCNQIGVTYLSDVGREVIENFQTWLLDGGATGRRAQTDPKPKRETVNHYLTAVRLLFGRAVEWEYLVTNPASRVKELELTDQRPARELTANELAGIIQKAPDRFRVHFMMYAATGFRKMEVFNLLREDIDLENRMVNLVSRPDALTKTRRSYSVPLPEWIIKPLAVYLGANPQPHPFKNCSSDMEKHGILNYFKQAVREAGILDWRFIRLHDLRHSYATLLAESGTNLSAIQMALGHTQIETTQRYARPSQEYLRKSVNQSLAPIGERLAS